MEQYIIERLQKNHDKETFDSGVSSLNNYLHKQASQDIKRHLSAVYILRESTQRSVYGYYTLSASSVLLDKLPPEIAKKLPRYPSIPVTLLGRLAIDVRLQNQGLGELLLIDALKRAALRSSEIGAMAVIVDALTEGARIFYEKYGFQKFLDKEQQLFLPMDVIKKI